MSTPGPTATEGVTRDDGRLFELFSVAVTQGPEEGVTQVASDERMVIGTHDSVHFRLTDKKVSRFHCELTPGAGGVLVRDLGSRNGTFVGAVRLTEATVPFGTTLALGGSRLQVLHHGDVGSRKHAATERFGVLVGQGPRMRQAFALLEKASRSDATVLLTGETGTGKEAAAQSIHAESGRASGPFVVVDCASVPSNLFEAELFGHERGAFTGAHAAREGAFVLADGGTLFIDEIGELALDLQPKLLRVLETREVKPIGAKKAVGVDVRIVAATHRDLRTEVNAKRFREDLYYRLAVIETRLPALRERVEDLPVLVRSLGEPLAKRFGCDMSKLSDPAFLDELSRHSWPGNVRELRNFLERTLVLGERPASWTPQASETSSDLVDVNVPIKEAREQVIASFEARYLRAILAASQDNVTHAAKAAGLDRVHFYRLLWRHGIKQAR